MDLYVIWDSFMEALNFTIPSKKYADSQNANTDSWAQDFVDWFGEGAQKFWALMSLPITEVPNVLNNWWRDGDDFVCWYKTAKMQSYEEIRIPATKYSEMKSYANELENDNTLSVSKNPTSDESLTTTAGVSKALLQNMVNSQRDTSDNSKKALDISIPLQNLTNGIMSMYNQDIIDKYEKILSGSIVITPSTNRDKCGEDISKWSSSFFYTYVKNNYPNLFNATDFQNLFKPYAQHSTKLASEISGAMVTSQVWYPPSANGGHAFVFTNKDNNIVLAIKAFPSESTYTNIVEKTENGFYISTADTFTVTFTFNSNFIMTRQGWPLGRFDYSNVDISKPYDFLYFKDATSETYMTLYDSGEVPINNRYIVDSNDTTKYGTDTAIPEEERKKKKKKTIIVDVENSGSETWTQDEPIDKEKTRDNTGTETIAQDATIQDVIDALQDIVDAISSATDTTTTSDSEPPIISTEPSITIPTGDTSVKGLFTVYNPSPSQVAGVASYLWSSIFTGDFIDQFKKWFSNPMDAIISLSFYPVVPNSDRTGTIKLGAFSTGVSGVNVVDNIFQTLNCGNVSIARYFNNFLDFSPFTKISLYLPFIGIVPLNVDDVMGGRIRIEYRYEFLTGSCIANVYVSNVRGNIMNEALLYQYSGNIAMQIPLSGANYSSVYSGILSGLATGISAYASGGASALGSIASGGTIALNQSKEHLQRSGSLGGNSGMLGIMKPYIIIERPIVSNENTFNNLLGKESNSFVKIEDIGGYTEIQNVDLSDIPCTSEEREMIYNILMSGFYA